MNSTSFPSSAQSSTAFVQPSVESISHDIYYFGLPAAALVAAQEAVHSVFPRARTQIVTDLNEVNAGECARCLVVLGTADAAAKLIADSGGAPRCAVVVLGHDASDVAETVPPEQWNAPLLARVFRSALLEQELVCENVRLRGDLKTVARRVSHDLRTPIGCIYTTSDVFKELPPGDQESVTSMAAVIKESAGEIAQIVDRVSFVLKASADPIAPSRVDLGGIVATVLAQLNAEIQKAGATVSVPSTWPEVAGVTTWLQTVWSNLVRNAVQHGGPKARIEIEWQKEGSNGYRFSVTDHGAGVPTPRLPGLFSPFDRIHTMHVSGLGLSFVERLVFLQGGRCGYEQPSAGGARFYFTLPASRSN